MKENKVSAVFKEDLLKLLTKIGEFDAILNDQRQCTVCSKIISIDNLQLLVPRKGGTYEYVCNDPDCVGKFNNGQNTGAR